MRTRHPLVVSFRMLAALTLLCGGLYPLAVTLLAHWMFPGRSNGSPVFIDGRLAGSELIAQNWVGPAYFHGRPSACAYSALPATASNLAPISAALHDSIAQRRSRFLKENGLADNTAVPAEMLFTSGSGLDPHINPQAARLQVERIAAHRHWNIEQTRELEALVKHMTEPRQLGFFGQPRVNVSKLNLMLDRIGGFRKLE
ncbi:MAG TPA: potassium-transporting ATPase subunit KdpC [bacterium]